ncbi:MAG TPA: 3-hydroxyacyl-[acyl-carrier-protein] dehydratase FabZ [Syntrophobacteraceae bacterium]|nr:3-hydroxyacyl-[acyl-carrier-protein] dehydratase FabZ [Syntrophobacteraceae bacterium]HBZ54335.1 3-hydroxyacyl-[acyl-carrier-protein] dehydratase FabZ [Syntrophobacteraceae bacterium]
MIKDIREVLKLLPHRYPFLLLDRVLELTSEQIVALKNVTINEPFFQGHFPGEPIMPGVLLVEAMAQAAGILGLSRLSETNAAAVYFMGMDRVRFRKPVRPGDQLIVKADVLKQKGTIFKMQAAVYVADQLVAEAELLATLNAGKRDAGDEP